MGNGQLVSDYDEGKGRDEAPNSASFLRKEELLAVILVVINITESNTRRTFQ